MDKLKKDYGPSFPTMMKIFLIWTIGLVFCLLIPLSRYRNLPDNYWPLIQQIIDTFGPPMSMMLALVFFRPENGNEAGQPRQNPTLPDLVAPWLSAVYVGIFCYLMMNHLLRWTTAEETVENIQKLRNLLAFLVSGSMAYYFGSKNNQIQGIPRNPSNLTSNPPGSQTP